MAMPKRRFLFFRCSNSIPSSWFIILSPVHTPVILTVRNFYRDLGSIQGSNVWYKRFIRHWLWRLLSSGCDTKNLVDIVQCFWGAHCLHLLCQNTVFRTVQVLTWLNYTVGVGHVLVLYGGDACFESLLCHHLTWLKFLVVLLSAPGMPEQCLV